MKKNILKLKGVQELDKKEQVSIKGGGPGGNTVCCQYNSAGQCTCRRLIGNFGEPTPPCNIPTEYSGGPGPICGFT